MDERKFFNQPDTERLRAMLSEDTDAAGDVDELLEVVNRLKKWDAPKADAKTTAQLFERLSQEMPVPAEANGVSSARRWGEWWPLLLMRSQLRVVRGEIWAASALVMLLGTLVTLTSFDGTPNTMNPIAIIAPLVAALGVGLLYDSDVEQMLELEDSTPASIRFLLLARLTLVFGFDLLLALVGSVALSVFHSEILLWPLVLSWLAPMTFLSALAFLLSIVSGDAIVGSLAGLMIWGAHILLHITPENGLLIYLMSLPGLSDPATRPLLFIVAPILVAAALWWAGQNERKVGDLS